MKTRIITGAVALAVFIAVLLAPPIVFTVALAAVIFMMLFECYTATKADTAMKVVGFVSAALIMGGIYLYTNATYRAYIATGIILAVILIYMTLLIFKHGKMNYKDILANGFLTMYIVLSMGCVWLLHETNGTAIMLLIFVCAWSCDTFAYFTGRFFGKRKLIPNVSPNKTVAGSVGGVIGAIAMCVLYLFIVTKVLKITPVIVDTLAVINLYWSPICVFAGVMIGLVGGICSQLGDLAASAIKRDTGIKDFGWIFPGHGGFMDRFDSVMFIAPIIYGIIVILSTYMLISHFGGFGV